MSELHGQRRRAASLPERAEPDNEHGLDPAPMPPEWIVEGNPVTRCRRLWGSTDDMAFTVMWDCTASRFDWPYDMDETICVLEGSVILTDPQGARHILQPMDTFHFPYGSRYHWNIPVYVRKLAFVHVPLNRKLRFAKRVFRGLKSLLRVRRRDQAAEGSALGG
jgi:uncharacterized protein